MEIVVLVKQVPDTESLIQIADDGVSVKTDDIKWVMNPYDEFAVEEALRIKEAEGGSVCILSLGPAKALETIRTALAMGADKGVHVLDPAADGSDSLGTAKILAAALAGLEYDLVIAGQRAVDGDAYQVGAGVAEFAGIPQVSLVNKQEIADGKIKCNSTVDGGIAVVEAALPMLFTTQRGLNEPRYASLPGIMKAKKKPVDVKTLADLGVDPETVGAANRKVKVTALTFPPQRQAIRMIEGDSAQEQAAQLVNILHSEVKAL